MTLPPNSIPSEPSSTANDLIAACGMPASPTDGAAPAAPFASLLTQADSGTTNSSTPTTAKPSQAATVPVVLYQSAYYMSQVGPAEGNSGEQQPLGESQKKDKSKASEKSETASDADPSQGSLVLAYQFIAGQWLQQPTVQPAAPQQTAGEGSDIQDGLGGLPVSCSASTDINNALVETSQPGENLKSGQPVFPSTPIQAKVAETPKQPEKSSGPLVAGTGTTEPSTQKSDVATTTALAADAAGTLNLNRSFTQGRTLSAQAQEKIADSGISGRSDSASGVNSPTRSEEKKSLSIDNKEVIVGSKKIGMSAANREIAMPYTAVNKAQPVALSTTIGDGVQPNVSADTTVDASLATQAPRLVQEIRTIADRISSIDRNTVEVRFDFSETDRLSVRVEYRDGIVHTTFQTDSSQLRDAVAREWQVQNVASESRNYRMADPVFTQTASDRQNSFADNSGHQRAFEQQAQSGGPSFGFSGRSVGSATPAVAPVARSARPETSLHLHALA